VGKCAKDVIQSLIANNLRDERSVSIKYVEKRTETFNRDFVEALASGKGRYDNSSPG